MTKSYFELMADYNQSMNQKIYAASAQLSQVALHEDQGAFFGSIIGTLNHILVGDIIWLKRFANVQQPVKALDAVKALAPPASLDTILFNDFSALQREREKVDKAIVLFVAELAESTLAQALSYNNTKGIAFTKNFGHLLQHFFNHQTHHRGQISTLLYQRGIDIGVTDLLVSIPDIDKVL